MKIVIVVATWDMSQLRKGRWQTQQGGVALFSRQDQGSQRLRKAPTITGQALCGQHTLTYLLLPPSHLCLHLGAANLTGKNWSCPLQA